MLSNAADLPPPLDLQRAGDIAKGGVTTFKVGAFFSGSCAHYFFSFSLAKPLPTRELSPVSFSAECADERGFLPRGE